LGVAVELGVAVDPSLAAVVPTILKKKPFTFFQVDWKGKRSFGEVFMFVEQFQHHFIVLHGDAKPFRLWNTMENYLKLSSQKHGTQQVLTKVMKQ